MIDVGKGGKGLSLETLVFCRGNRPFFLLISQFPTFPLPPLLSWRFLPLLPSEERRGRRAWGRGVAVGSGKTRFMPHLIAFASRTYMLPTEAGSGREKGHAEGSEQRQGRQQQGRGRHEQDG